MSPRRCGRRDRAARPCRGGRRRRRRASTRRPWSRPGLSPGRDPARRTGSPPARSPDRDPSPSHVLLDPGDAPLAEVEDARGQHRPRPGVYRRDHILRSPRAPRGDDGDAGLPGDGGDELQVVAALRPVGVHAVEDELTGPPPLPLHEPGDGVQARVHPATVQVHLPAWTGGPALHVHAEDDALAPETLRALVYEVGVPYGGAVNGDLVGPGAQHGAHVVGRPDPAADGVGDKDLLGGLAGELGCGVPLFVRGRDVVEDDLVRPLPVVEGRELDRVTGVPEVLEPGPLHDAACIHVEAGDYAHEEAHRHTYGTPADRHSSAMRSWRIPAAGSRTEPSSPVPTTTEP